MKQNDPSQVKALKWHLNFLSDHLDALSYLEFSGRVLEAKHYFASSALFLPLNDPLWKDIDPFDYILHVDLKGGEVPEDKNTLKKIQADLRELLKRMQTDGAPIPIENVRVVSGVKDGRFFTKYYLPLDYRDIFTPRRMKQLARLSFANALHGVPLEAIRTCRNETCGRYFLHLSQKDKYYCSPKCTSRDLAKKRREADPDLYRKKQRGIMRKKSKEKKRKGGKKK